jgi:OCT family organic cation transporter-like MFS transporter 4/5
MVIGMTTSGVFLVSYVLAMESVGPKYRVIAGTLCQYYYTFGMFVMAFVAYFLNYDWKLLQLVLTAPTVLFLSYWWIVPESVRWMIRKGKYDEAKAQIETMAAENKAELPPGLVDDMITAYKEEDVKTGAKTASILDLLTHMNMLKKSLILFFLWFVNSGTYYGLSLGASNLGGNPYINFLISAAVEIPAYACNLVLLNNPKVGRRLALCGFMLIAGLALTITIFVPRNMTPLLITLSMIGKLAITTSYGIVYIFTAELFPTVIRNVGVGASSLCARIGGILCPYINLLGDHWRPLPLIIYGVLAFTGGLLSLFLPETLNKELPETMEDGEKFGKNEESSSSSCCRKKTADI